MVEIILDNAVRFKTDFLEKNHSAIFDKLIERFTYDNPKYLENEKYGYSNHNVDRYLFSYKFDDRNGVIEFSRGILKYILRQFNIHAIPYQLTDRTLLLDSVSYTSKVTPRKEQVDFIDALVKGKQGIALAFTSFGKCHEKGYKVLKFDGSLINVEDVVAGDLLMGPDSKPRKVLNTCRGRDTLYRINPLRGDSFVVNSKHKLSLKVTGNNRHASPRVKDKDLWKKGSIKNIELDEYLGYSTGKKHILKLWQSGVEFKKQNVLYDPYYIGLHTGDGSKGNATITNNNELPITEYLHNYADELGYSIRESKNSSGAFSIHFITDGKKNGHALRQYLRKECLIGEKTGTDVKGMEKTIPEEYILNDRQTRLKLLAGLIDSDGYLINNKKSYELACKQEHLKDKIVFLVRSLGLHCGVKKKRCGYTKNGKRFETGFVFILYISGQDLTDIPVKLERKKIKEKMFRNPLTSGFKVEEVGIGDYYGFNLDGDHLYLGYDFRVHHNSLSTLEAVAQIGQKAVIVVHTEFLQKQWIKEATNSKLFNLDKSRIGGCGGVFRDKPRVGDINICLYHSLSSPRFLKMFKNKVGVIVADECLGEDTLILTNVGQKRLAEIKIGDYVIDPNGNKVKVIDKWETEKEAFEVTFKNGNKVVCSANHLFRSFKQKYKKFEIKNGDFVNASLKDNITNIQNFSVVKPQKLNRFNEFLGFYLADGCKVNNRLRFGLSKSDKVVYLKELLFDLGINFRSSTNTRGDTIITIDYSDVKCSYFEEIINSDTNEKFIPNSLFSSIDFSVLKGLFNGDGCFTNTYVEFDSTSEKMSYQIFNMLLNSGIYCSIYNYERRNNESDIFRIIISGQSIKRFNQAIGFNVFNKKEKINKYIPKIKKENHVSWISSVKPLGKRKLIDITVDSEDKLFVANGLITHNCQKLAIEAMHGCVNHFPAKYRWGVSANHKRKDKKEFLVEDTLGEIVYNAEEVDGDSKILSNVHLVQTNYRDYDYEFDKQYSNFITRMSKDKTRNTMILRRVVKQVNKGLQVMVLVERKEQACLFASALRKKGIKTALLIGPVSKKSINQFESNSAKKVALEYDDKKAYDYVKQKAEAKEIQVIIGTQKAEVGLSVRTLNYGIVTTPMGSNVADRLNQIVGRFERTHGSELEKKFGVKPRPIVELLVDNKIKSFKRHKKAIKDFYGDRCFIVKES
jgi:superfamily II DNA or RNA helicase